MTLKELADELEIISRVYERRHGVERTDDWLVLELQDEEGSRAATDIGGHL